MYISVMTFFMLLMWLTYQIHILKTKKKIWFFQVCLCKVRFKLSSFAIVRRYPVQSDWNGLNHVFFLLNSFLLTQNRKSLEILLLWLTGLSISFTIQHECQQWIIYSGLYCIASVRIDVFSSKFINSPVLAPGNFLCCHFLNGIYAERHFFIFDENCRWMNPTTKFPMIFNSSFKRSVINASCGVKMFKKDAMPAMHCICCVLSRSMGRFLVLLEMLLS